MNQTQYGFLAELNSEPLKRVAELQRCTMAIGLVFVFLLMKCKLVDDLGFWEDWYDIRES